MSAAFQLVAALPHALQYRWVYDGVEGESATLTQQQLLDAAIPNGLLQKALHAVTTDEAWAALQSQIKIVVSPNLFGRARTPLEGKIGMDGTNRVVSVQAKKPDAVGVATVEIRLV